MLGKSLTAVALLAAQATAKIYYAGVAESGGEFGVYSTSISSTTTSNVQLTDTHKATRAKLALGFQASSERIMPSSTRLVLMSTLTSTRLVCNPYVRLRC